MHKMFGIALLVSCGSVCGVKVAPAQPGRPVILFIHGRDQAWNVTSQLRATWFGAFRDGAAKIGAPDDMIADSDLRFINYQDIYEPGYQVIGCAGIRPSGGSDTEQLATRNFLDGFLNALSDALSHVGLISYAATNLLSDTRRYFADPDVACDTNARLIGALKRARDEQRPVILVAHSLGSQIAFAVLTDAGADQARLGTVARFITVGSQVGLPDVIHSLRPKLPGAPFTIPPLVKTWINARGREDYVAPRLVKANFADPRSLLRESEIETQPGAQHAITGYLKNPYVAEAIVKGWCLAFPVGTAPQVCRALPDVP